MGNPTLNRGRGGGVEKQQTKVWTNVSNKYIKALQQKVRSIQVKFVGCKERQDFFVEYYL